MDTNPSDRFTFFRSFETAYDKLKTLEEKHEFLKMVMRMGFDGVEPEPSESMPYILYDVGAREKLVKGREIRAGGGWVETSRKKYIIPNAQGWAIG